MNNPLGTYIQSAQSEESTTPSMMNEANILLFIQKITNEDILSYEELRDANITNIFVYDIPDDKKEFNIETVRNCIIDIEMRPYAGKHIFILRHFDTANGYAQNALLKILEECPSYAIIIIEVENPHALLETVRSRIINLVHTENQSLLPVGGESIIQSYLQKNHAELARSLYELKCTSSEAIQILRGVYPHLTNDEIPLYMDAIDSLSATHENPKYILNVFFL